MWTHFKLKKKKVPLLFRVEGQSPVCQERSTHGMKTIGGVKEQAQCYFGPPRPEAATRHPLDTTAPSMHLFSWPLLPSAGHLAHSTVHHHRQSRFPLHLFISATCGCAQHSSCALSPTVCCPPVNTHLCDT